jgi:RHS repeat-associated protein
MAGTTIIFVGNHYEVSGSTITKYYFAGASRVAMRTGSSLRYLLSDHLGSTSIVTNGVGTVVSEMRYREASPQRSEGDKAWGEVRYTSGTTPTKYTYTGQYTYTADFGLMYYNARWYDPALGRFAQADTIIPQATQGVQAWDRYAYANNNPVLYNDNTGHCILCDVILAGIVLGIVAYAAWDSLKNNPQTVEQIYDAIFEPGPGPSNRRCDTTRYLSWRTRSS